MSKFLKKILELAANVNRGPKQLNNLQLRRCLLVALNSMIETQAVKVELFLSR